MEPTSAYASQVWEDFGTTVTIRPGNIPEHFEWEEQRDYTIFCALGGCTHPLRMETSYKIDYQNLEEVLNKIIYTIRVDNAVQFDFQKWFAPHKDKAASSPFLIEADGAIVEYSGTWLKIVFAKDYSISQQRTSVALHERTFISSHDRCYALFLRYPTKGLRANISIDVAGWTVKQPDASATVYAPGRGSDIVHIDSDRTATVRVPGWTLPGLGLVAEWAPR
jgi:hypothetical protein